ncbi:porphobilinogen synthase [Metallumcola ferriviriculae]|uniref:Delta-aminolevulinic acid dehydratase n=1 Tax=Metallumcola ferriviriculae TaxID=3039180 RepID=A0AAU0UMG3_9FIRM|nr:porphobilinogen synthase [Desulfitibacteraceae bacterium MK1]
MEVENLYFPTLRPRRLRGSETLRRMVRENLLTVDDLIYPMFVIYGEEVANPISSMPGVCQYSVDKLLPAVGEVVELGIPAIILFGIPDVKDEKGSGAYAADGIVQEAIRAIKKEYPDLLVITDVCLCEFTSHGHCGIVHEGDVLNDPTLEFLARTALSHVEAGADMVAPSDMMDGRVRAIREKLDDNGYSKIPIMAYSAKYSSAFYGPFREAAESAPQFGDRRSYQMDPPNSDEAIKETLLDIEEGADIVMVKPALAYMDIIRRLKDEFTYPVAAYNVSGEYSMIKAAAEKGWIDEQAVVMEMLTGMKRAGADLILTYFAKDAAKWLKDR